MAEQAGVSKDAALSLATLRPAKGSRPKRVRIGRGHGSGMVKTGGEGGKGQTVRSGGGKGPAFEGGQTPWARRLPQRRGVSQKARDIGHFRTFLTVVDVNVLLDWPVDVVITPQTLREAGIVKQVRDGVKLLGRLIEGERLPQGLRCEDILFSASARETLAAAGAHLPDAAA